MNRSLRRLPALLCALAALVMGGCTHPGPLDPARQGPFFTPTNKTGDARLPTSVRRVVLLPVHGGAFAAPETAEMLDPVFATALEKQQRFEVVTLSRDECAKSFGAADIDSTAALPRDLLPSLAEKFGAQAVLFVDLTAYSAYRPMALGVRAKLITIADRRIIWGFDQILATTDAAVVNSLRHFYLLNDLGALPFDVSTDALNSPNRFAAYVSDVVFHTLPPR